MYGKSKLIVGLVLLAVGAGLVPTGFIINQYFVDQVYEGVPEALLKIKDDATESLEGQIPGLATPDILLNLKAEMEAQLPALINCTTTANLINETVDLLVLAYGLDIGTNIFFNDPTFQVDLSGMGFGPFFKGVSNFTGVNMGYTLTARQTLLFDGISVPGVGDVPGLIDDTDLGTGVCGFLEIYNASLTNYLLNQTIQALYNASWLQLTTIAGWLQYHVFPDIVPTAFFAQYQMTVSEAENYGFYYQWANGTLVSDGIDLSVFLEDYDEELKGFEAGVPTQTGIANLTTISMWTPSNPLSFVNKTGIWIWLNTSYQSTITTAFGISDPQYFMVLGWLGNFITTLTPVLILAETGYTIQTLALFAFYEQWANGTIFGESILPEGFLSERDPPIYGPPYCEVGLTEGATGLTLTQTMALWNEASDYSLVTVSGINKWYSAKPFNSTAYVALKLYNGVLTDVQMEQILDWLPKFRDDIVNKLAKDDKDLPMEPYDLGNAILIGLGVGGGALAAVGIIFLILSRRF